MQHHFAPAMYDEEELDMEDTGDFSRNELRRQKEVYCTKAAGSVQFLTAKDRWWMSVEVKGKKAPPKKLMVGLLQYKYNSRVHDIDCGVSSIGRKSVRVTLAHTASVRTQEWCPKSTAHGNIVLSFDF